MDILIVSALLVVVLYLLITETIAVDLTAIGIMVALVVSGILSPQEAVEGLANPAVVTVAAMFVVSRGLMRTGGVEFLGRQVVKVARKNLVAALALILFSVGFASAFINNTPIVLLFIPVVMAMCCDLKLSPSSFLIPVSYASILAGTCTLIGTSTNIIVSDLSAHYGYGELTMFELAAVAVPIAVVGIAFMLVCAPRLLPSSTNPTCQLQDSEHRRYLAELQVRDGSRHIGLSPEKAFDKYPELEVIELISDSQIYQPGRDRKKIAANDILLVKGLANDLVELLHEDGIELPDVEKDLVLGVQKDAPIVVELLVAPGSRMSGQKLADTELAKDPALHIIAVKRRGLRLAERLLQDFRIKAGDIMLIWCGDSKLESLRGERDYVIIEDVYEELVHKRKAWWALINFGCMIGTAALGIADIMTCALTAAFLMIITGCLQVRDAYRALQSDVLLLIAATIALGTAMNKSGASEMYAGYFLSLFKEMPPIVVLCGIITLTSIATQILSNNAAAVLLLPIAISTAVGVGVDPKPFIVGVCIGASACFASPLGYQTNLMVYGPGGYRFIDYLRLGIPLNLLVIGASTVMIPLIWHF